MYVYKITNKINGKAYIGQTTREPKKRWNAHCNKHYKYIYITRAILKYGKKNFKFEVIGGATNMTELNYQEWIQIHIHQTLYPNGYNMQEGGYNSRASLETRLRMKKANRIKFSGESGVRVRKKMSEARRGFKEPESMLDKKRKKVICHQNGKIYKSQKAAAEDLGLFNNMISAVCLGKRRHTKGYTFDFYEEERD